MIRKFVQKEINIKDIDLTDRSYICTFEPMMSQMVQSVREIGLINPPIVAQIDDQPKYRVISGLKRVLALIHLHHDRVNARVEQERSAELSLENFLINFYENLSTRELNPIEKSIILNKLRDQFQVRQETLLNQYLPLLGLGSNPKVLNRYLMLTKLEDDLKIAIVEDTLSHELAIQLLRISFADRRAIFDFIQALRLGKNRQKEFVRLFSDIAKMNNTQISTIIKSDEVDSIVNHPKITTSQKVEKVRQVLNAKRYPLYSDAEQSFNQIRKDMKLPPEVLLRHPAFFEGKKYSVEFIFHNQEEFEQRLSKLNDILKRGYIKKLKTIGA